MKSKVLIPLGAAVMMLAGCATRPPRQAVGARADTPMPPADPRASRQQPADPRVTVLDGDFHAMPEVAPARPAPTFEVPPAPAPAPRTGEPYTIRRGDTLSGIAARHRMTWRELADYNHIADPNSVRAGQVILIPSDAAPTARPAPEPPAVTAGEGEYVVRAGDNLSVIARRHGTTVAALRQVNNLTSDRILVGQRLKLPAGAQADRPRETPAPRPTPRPETRPTPRPTPAPARPTPMPVEEGLRLPDAPPAATPAPAADPEPVAGRSFPIIVEEGDTLESIANSYIMSVEALQIGRAHV